MNALGFIKNLAMALMEPKPAYVVLTYNGESFTFPVTPGTFRNESGNNNSTVNVNALGEMNMIGTRKLETVSFQSFFPAQRYGFEVAPGPSPNVCVQKIKQISRTKKPCRIAITGTAVSMTCTIEDFDHWEQDGTGDIYFQISLKEYRYFRPESETSDDVTGLKSRVADSDKEKLINIAPGASALDIADKAVRKFTTIDQQQLRRLALAKEIVKSGAAGDTLMATKNMIKLGNVKIGR